jgi:hypothetical protein
MSVLIVPSFKDTANITMYNIVTLVFSTHSVWLPSQSSKWKFEFTGLNQILEFIFIYIVLNKNWKKLALLWAQLTKIYPPLPTSVQSISITKTLLIVPTKNERDPPLFTGKLLIKFQNILRNTTQVIIRHRVKILFSVISSPITLERQKWKSSKMKGILLSSPVSCW